MKVVEGLKVVESRKLHLQLFSTILNNIQLLIIQSSTVALNDVQFPLILNDTSDKKSVPMYNFGFEKLVVWQESKKLALGIYRLTEKFPEREKFGLTNQLRRASVSVGSNIAEGTTRASAKEQAHFSSIAFGSLMETMSHLLTSFELNFITEEDLLEMRSLIQPLSLKINNLRNTQLAKVKKE